MRGHIFDMDGTIIDSIPAYREVAVKVLLKHFPHLSVDEATDAYDNTLGRPFPEQLELSGLYSLDAIKEYEDLSKNISIDAIPFPEAVEYIKGFDDSEDEYIGIVSSSSTYIVNKVIKKHFSSVFDWISGIELGDKLHQIQFFLAQFGINPSDATFYGDTDADRGFAYEAGVFFVSVKDPERWKVLISGRS